MLLELFDPTFEITVSNERLPTLVAFVSDGCPHCSALKPQLDALEPRFRGKVKTYAVNVERSPSLGGFFGVEGVPMIVGFLHGQPVWKHLGLPESPDVLAKMYEELQQRSKVSWGGTPG